MISGANAAATKPHTERAVPIKHTILQPNLSHRLPANKPKKQTKDTVTYSRENYDVEEEEDNDGNKVEH